MIDPDRRKAIFLLHDEGMGSREISRRLKVSRNTVRAIIKHGGAMPDTVRDDKINIDHELLSRLYTDCSGFIQRIYEKLREEEGITDFFCLPMLSFLRILFNMRLISSKQTVRPSIK